MKEFRYTLLSDGVSDQALIPILTWLLREHGIDIAIQSEWADPRRLPKPPIELSERMRLSVELYPCDLLFVHRDAEREPAEKRVEEINKAKQALGETWKSPTVCVVPVRMQEAWLLFDEPAIRWAAGNKNGRMSLVLPRIQDVEQLPDPKSDLHELLREACGLKGRRRKQFPAPTYARRVAEFIEDFTPLRRLAAFRALEDELEQSILKNGWRERA